MFDARYIAFSTISALLVVSPGATMAVVMETVLGEGRAAGLFTVLGVNIGNSTLALASALGLSLLFEAWPSALHAVKVGGAVYLAYLGARGLYCAWSGRPPLEPVASAAPVRHRPATAGPWAGARSPWSYLGRGIATNLLNPPVVLFYMTLLPQFIGPGDPFFARFLLLAATHVGMSLVWLGSYAFTLGVLADRFARPAVRRALEGLTGAALLGLAARLALR